MRYQITQRFAALCSVLLLLPTWGFAQSTGGTGGATGGGTASGGSYGSGGGTSGGSGASGGLNLGSGTGLTNTSPAATIKPSTGSGGNSASAIPSATDFFGPYMGNPLSRGMASSYYPTAGTFGTFNSAAPIFGKAIYASTTTTTPGATGTTTATTNSGFSTVGQIRAPSYSTILSPDFPVRTFNATAVQQSVQDVIARSSFLQSRGNIQVAVNGSTVTLRGQVQSAKEARLAENMTRSTPGVRNVVNELQVSSNIVSQNR